jgi:DNA polymerase-3 subunit epsilon
VAFDFVAIDFETANHDRWSACAVGLTAVRRGEVVSSTSHLIRPPSRRFEWACARVHQLDWDDVRRAPDFAELWTTTLRAVVADQVLVAHQAWFDRDVFAACLKRYGIRHRANRFACSLTLARDAFRFKHFGLKGLCRRLRIPLREHHEPGADARAAARITLLAAERVGVRSATRLAKEYGV